MNKQDSDLSLCPNCNCMTKTIKGKCGKCGADNYDDHQPQTVGVELPDPIDKQIDEIDELLALLIQREITPADFSNAIQVIIALAQTEARIDDYIHTFGEFAEVNLNADVIVPSYIKSQLYYDIAEELKRGSDV